MRLSAAVPLLVLLIPACDSGNAEAARETREVRGDTTIVTAGAPQWGDSVALVEELRIGELDGREEYTFGRISGVAVGAAGEMYVIDDIAKTVRVFGVEGRFVRRFGRDGGGPGELRQPAGIGLLPDGRVAVRDFGNKRYNIYSPEGESLEGWTFLGNYATSAPFFIDTAGRLYNPMNVGKPGEGWKYGLELFGSDGVVIDTLAPPTWGLEPMTVTATSKDGGARATYGIPFTPNEQWTLSPAGHFVGGLTDRYAIDLIYPDGRVLRVARSVPQVPVAAEEGKAATENALRGLRMTVPDYSWNGPPVPEVKPFFGTIKVDADNRLWVSTSQPGYAVPIPEEELADAPADAPRERWDAPRVRDVFDSTGAFLGTVTLPDRFEPHVMRGEYVWGVISDEYDVQYVVRYRIEHA